MEHMLRARVLPLEISMDLSAPRGFAVPSPTNISLLNNFPFASPDINEPGSPLGYDLNSNLEHFSNSLLDINESADVNGLNFSPSSDLNLSPQESPIFQLFTGPSLELGLPQTTEPPAHYFPSKETRPFSDAALSLQRTPFSTPSQVRSERLPEPYADLSSEDIIQQKRDDAFWAAYFFFSHYFEPVLVGGGKDLSLVLNKEGPDAGPGVDRQVFVVQNDVENSYMWFLKASPANALGRMQLQGFINGRHQAGQAAFPYSSAGGFVRSHKLQRKRYKGLSNPQCIHGLRTVSAPPFSETRPDDKKRFEELTNRPLGTALPPEAADYNAWRRVPERADAAPSPVESTSQTIQFLPGQDAQKRSAKQPAVTDPESQGSKGGAKGAKRKRKGPTAKNGAASEGEGNAASAEPVQSRVAELGSGETGEASAVSNRYSETLVTGQSAVEAERNAGGTEPRRVVAARSATPVTDLTLQWRAEIEWNRSQVLGRSSNGSLAPRTTEGRQSVQRPEPLPASAGLQRDPGSSGRTLEPAMRPTRDRAGIRGGGFVPLSKSTARPLGEGLTGGLVHPRDACAVDRRNRHRWSTLGDLPRADPEWDPGETGPSIETLSEDGHPQDDPPTAAEAEASREGDQGDPSQQAQDPADIGRPACAVAPPGVRLTAPGNVANAGGFRRACSEVLYEDEKGYLLFVSLPFTDLQRVRVTWRNVGETGVVKLDGLGPARVVARGSRVMRLSNWGWGAEGAAREIMLPTRIPEDASIEAHFSADCAGLEVSVPKHAACTEERPVRLFLPEQRQLQRGP